MCVLSLHEVTLDALALCVHKMEHDQALAFTRAATPQQFYRHFVVQIKSHLH